MIAGGKHQQRVNGRRMREAGRSQQARGRHVVDEVGDSNQAGSGKQRQAATEKF